MNDENLEKLLRKIDKEDDYAWLKETNAKLREEIRILFDKNKQLEADNTEQCVLLGKGGERECALLGKVEQLERENDSLIENVRGMEQMVDRLERDNAALREDKERLDWLGQSQLVSTTRRGIFATPQSLRAAIDAARAKEDGQP